MIRLAMLHYSRYIDFIQFMNNAATPSIVRPMEDAWQDMVERLFRPARSSLWIGIGFTAWLAHVGEGGIQLDIPPEFRTLLTDQHWLRTQWLGHGGLIVGLVTTVALVMLSLLMLLLWLRCRGTFMFLDNVVQRRGEVVEPWRRSARLGFWLFRWSLGFIAIMSFFLVLALSPLAASGYGRLRGVETLYMATALGLSVPLLLAWALGFTVISWLLHDFVVPIMARNNLPASAAWHQLKKPLSQQPLAFLGYGLLRVAITAAVSAGVFVGGCLTCCCLWVLLMVPVLWAIILLPLFVLLRLYSLEFLRQFGPEFDAWALPDPPRLPPSLPGNESPPPDITP